MIEFELFLKGYPSPENNFSFHLKKDFRFKNDFCKGKIFYKNYNSFFNKRRNFGKFYSRVSLLDFASLKRKIDISKKVKKSDLIDKNSNTKVLNKKVILPFNNYFKPKKIFYPNTTHFTINGLINCLPANKLSKPKKSHYFIYTPHQKVDIFKKIRKFNLSNINNTLDIFNKEIISPYSNYFKPKKIIHYHNTSNFAAPNFLDHLVKNEPLKFKKPYYFSDTSFLKIKKFDLSNINNTLQVFNKEMILPYNNYFKPKKTIYHDTSYLNVPNFSDYFSKNELLELKKPYYFNDTYFKKIDIFRKVRKFSLSNSNDNLELFNKEILSPFNNYFKPKESRYLSYTSPQKVDIFKKIRKFDLSNINNTLEVFNKEIVLPYNYYFKPKKTIYHDTTYFNVLNFSDYFSKNELLKFKKPYYFNDTYFKKIDIFKKIRKFNLLNSNNNLEIFNREIVSPYNSYFKPKKIIYHNTSYSTVLNFLDHFSKNEPLRLKKSYYFGDTYFKKIDFSKKIKKFDLSNKNNIVEFFDKETVLPYSNYFRYRKIIYPNMFRYTIHGLINYSPKNELLKPKKPYCLSYTSYKENDSLNIFKKTPSNNTFIDFKKCLRRNQIF